MARITGLAIGDNRIKLEDADSINNKINTEAQVRETADKILQANIGDVTKLHTATQNSAVEAINEVLATRVEANPVGVMLVNYLYPIGSIYLSLDATFNPNTAWQGTKWELIEAGRYLRATQTEANVGQNVEEALPNIQGGAGRYVSAGGHFSTGAMWISDGVNLNGYGGAGGYMHYSVRFNAARYSSVYKDGAKVTPNSIDIYMWKRIEWPDAYDTPEKRYYWNVGRDAANPNIEPVDISIENGVVKTRVNNDWWWADYTYVKNSSKDNPCPNIRLNDSQNDATKDRVEPSYILYKDADGNWQWEGTVNGQKYTRYIRETEDEAKNKLQSLS